MIIPAMRHMANGKKHLAIVGSTGSGKTSVAVWWAKQAAAKGRKVYFVVPKDPIMKQFMETCRNFDLDFSSIYSGSRIFKNNIQICMKGTLVNRLNQVPTPDLLIYDEAHHMGIDNQLGQIDHTFRSRNPNLKSLLFTATPNGLTNGRGLHPFAEELIDELSVEYLVNEGWLVFPHTMIGEKLEVPKFNKNSMGEYDNTDQIEKHWSKREVINCYVDAYFKDIYPLPAIGACSGLKHAAKVADQFNEAARGRSCHFKAVMVQGGKKYQKQLFDAIEGMKKGTVQYIAFDSVFGEGIDVPFCCGVQWLKKTSSLVNWKQYNGRSLRPVWADGFDQYNSTVESRLLSIASSVKPMAKIQDFAGNHEEHGHPISKPPWTLQDTIVHGKNSMKMPEYSTCPRCRGVWPGVVKMCPGIFPDGSLCGYEFPAEKKKKDRKLPKSVEGALKELSPGFEAEKIFNVMQKAAELSKMSEAERRRYLMNMIKRSADSTESKAVANVLGYEFSGNYTDLIYKKMLNNGELG